MLVDSPVDGPKRSKNNKESNQVPSLRKGPVLTLAPYENNPPFFRGWLVIHQNIVFMFMKDRVDIQQIWSIVDIEFINDILKFLLGTFLLLDMVLVAQNEALYSQFECAPDPTTNTVYTKCMIRIYIL